MNKLSFEYLGENPIAIEGKNGDEEIVSQGDIVERPKSFIVTHILRPGPKLWKLRTE